MRIAGLVIILTGLLFPLKSLAQKELPPGYQYVFPRQGAKNVHPNSTIILRLEILSPGELSNPGSIIKVAGEISGTHSGKTIIASDKRTLIFEPERNYKPGEKVNVTIDPQFPEYKKNPIKPINFEFEVLEKEVANKTKAEEKNFSYPWQENASNVKTGMMSNGVSVPSDFPHVNITHNDNPSSDYVFVNTMIPPFYNIIFNTLGDPVWYRKTSDLREDFRVQANGWITMQIREGYEEPDLGHIAFTQNFEYIKSFHATNLYSTD